MLLMGIWPACGMPGLQAAASHTLSNGFLKHQQPLLLGCGEACSHIHHVADPLIGWRCRLISTKETLPLVPVL